MEAAGTRTSTPKSGDIEQLRESSGGCGLLLELEESGRLKHAPEVERVLQLCAQVAAIHTQKELLDACNPPKSCPGCFWVFFAVCLQQHPTLSHVIARIIENLSHDRRRNIVTLIMAPMRLIRAAWSRNRASVALPTEDARRYPFMGNCLDFQTEVVSDRGEAISIVSLDFHTEVEGIGTLRHGRLFFGPGDRSFSHRAGKIMLSRELRARLDECEEDEAAYARLVRNVTAYLHEGRVDWMETNDPVPPPPSPIVTIDARFVFWNEKGGFGYAKPVDNTQTKVRLFVWIVSALKCDA
jgi:hypothetical protein